MEEMENFEKPKNIATLLHHGLPVFRISCPLHFPEFSLVSFTELVKTHLESAICRVQGLKTINNCEKPKNISMSILFARSHPFFYFRALAALPSRFFLLLIYSICKSTLKCNI